MIFLTCNIPPDSILSKSYDQQTLIYNLKAASPQSRESIFLFQNFAF